MVKRRTVVGTVVAVAAFLVACGEGDSITVVSGGETGQATTGITISGLGEVSAPTDTGFITLGVQSDEATVAAAREKAAATQTALVASVKANGVDAKDIQTVNLSIYPRYDQRQNEEPRIIGYTVYNTINVKVRVLDSFSKVVDDAVAAGGDDTRIQNIYFSIEDITALAAEARDLAVKDARTKAEQIAAAAGVQLGEPISISETQTPSQPIFTSADAANRSQSVSTPIESGSGKVTANVTVRWSIKTP